MPSENPTDEYKAANHTNPKSSDESESAPELPPPARIPPVEIPPAPRGYQITCKTEKDWRDKVKFWAELFGLVVLIVYTAFAGCQWKVANDTLTEIRKSKADTNRIISASETQARAAQKIADASTRNTAAAEKFSDSAEGINRHTDAAVTQFHDLADATKQVADTATEAMKIQASPWVGITEMSLIEQDPYWGYVRFKLFASNDGSTPAMNLRTVFEIAVFDKRYPTNADFDKDRGLSDRAREQYESSRGTLLPHKSYETPAVIVPLTIPQSNDMRKGNHWLFILAEITYDDTFGDRLISSVCNRLEDGKLLACNVRNTIRRLPQEH